MKTLILIVLLAGISSAEAEETTRYCYSEELFANTTPLGPFQAWLEIAPRNRGIEVSFEDKMPDAAQYIFFDRVIARHTQDGSYTFQFEDNWENHGSGKLTLSDGSVVLRFERIVPGESPLGRNATRGYADMTLTRKACADVPRFSHPQ